ncbi:CHAT domain-containing protein [Solirubrobacter phytolaccae]|uniref:CHAT domain-containing protein n=1 Tax=Solirubrobacter phytolaccae TaxID=1404360 RepID=A0A9X3SA43_9ACTN|nr:CHAT domain-containing protein [Solirubrobacter phytolaccae]MDA0182196.1 CHAT domain-containing protein [Solirubrobacter phytolaccae]
MRAAVIDLLSRLDELEDPAEEERVRAQLLELLAELSGPPQPDRFRFEELLEADFSGDPLITTEQHMAEREPGQPVYARIDTLDTVVAEHPFEVTVGLTTVLDPELFSTVMDLPPGDQRITVHVTADGISLEPGQVWRHELHVKDDEPLPSVTLRLKAEPQLAEEREARIQALYLHHGHTIGFGSRSLIVTRGADVQPELVPTTPEAEGVLALPRGLPAPDLTIDIRRGRFPGELMWVFDTSHDLPVPDEAPITSVGDAPREYARSLILRANAREGQSDLFAFLRGIGKEIAEAMPPEWTALLAAVADRVGRPPLVQILSEEPHIPWELAWLDERIDPEAPGFLAAQACVGRWLLSERNPPWPAPPAVDGERMAAIWGEYAAPGWQRLLAAEDEGRALQARFGAAHVPATLDDVTRCLEGAPQADVLHFAVHGHYDPGGGMDGLVLTDQRTLDPTVVRGMDLPHRPFVFLNACQVGMGREVLGDYGGMAMALVKAGASAVVAPLWSIDDQHAARVALEFYAEIQAGAQPADVLRRARAADGPEPSRASGTCFAYQFFGHPAMRLSLANGSSQL